MSPPSWDRRHGRTADQIRQVASAGLIAGGIIAGATGDYGSAQDSSNPLLPADAAFAIWLPIYAGCLGYGVYQALPTQAHRLIHRRAGLPLAVCVGLTGTWVWLQDPPQRQLPAILVTLAAGSVAYRRATRWSESTVDRWLVAAPAGLLMGWLSLASIVATIEIARALRWPSPPAPRTAVLLTLGAITALGVRSRGAASTPRTYAAALSWGLAGISAASRRQDRVRSAAAALGAAIILSTKKSRHARP